MFIGDLSPVQRLGLEYMMLLEARDTRRESEEALKRAVLSADPAQWFPVLYPGAKPSQAVREETVDADLADSGPMEWQMDSEMTAEEAQRILEDMANDGMGSMSLDDLDEFEGERNGSVG